MKIKEPKRNLLTTRIFSLTSKVQNKLKRNLLRGFYSKQYLSNEELELIRANNSLNDNMIIGSVLKGPNGLLNKTVTGRKIRSADIFNIVKFPALDWKSEIAYTIGYLSSEQEKCLKIIDGINKLSDLHINEAEFFLNGIREFSDQFGASNYISYKLAYARSSRPLSVIDLSIISDIESNIEHRLMPGLHFSALENLSSKISLFVVARRRISGLASRKLENFRSSLSLSNFIPTPVDLMDVGGFLLRATESSLVDTTYALIVLFNLSEFLPEIRKELDVRVPSAIRAAIISLQEKCQNIEDISIVTDHYHMQNHDSDYSLDLYRCSAAFLEHPKYAQFRNKFDRIIGVRLLAEINVSIDKDSIKTYDDKDFILSPDEVPIPSEFLCKLDAFYRTYLFLRHINDRNNIINFTSNEIKFIFENTLGLEALLSENEIETFYLTAPKSSKSLVAVLALALFRQKSIDPDVDFDFRSDFINHITNEYNSSILHFIEDLLKDSPSVANYIVGSLDEVTLEKMYTLVKNATQASNIRRDILKAVGQKLNRIEYFIEADSIITRSKVATLQKYFDSSRMYVDSVAMKKWLDSNPSVSTEQYREIYRQANNKISSVTHAATIKDTKVLVVKFEDETDEFLVTQIAKDAFEQFCLNKEFGIQSYLGRRIRHNTLDGVTIETIDAVLKKMEYAAIITHPGLKRSIQTWLSTYKLLIERLRRDQLQFKSSVSLFNSNLSLDDSTTKENIRKLSASLRSAGGADLLNDLIIAFCWKQITPQLENASRYIKSEVLKNAHNSIDQHFYRYTGTVEDRLKSDLHAAINDVLKKVASWFQVPQTGFIPASVRDLCHIIILDLNRPPSQIEWQGDGLDKKYTGISVHRMYDCLAALLQNAFEHGLNGKPVLVKVQSSDNCGKSFLDSVTITITSHADEASYAKQKSRIQNALDAVEKAEDMVNEGFTGIKKVKFITRMSEGAHTVTSRFSDEERTLSIEFSLHAESSSD